MPFTKIRRGKNRGKYRSPTGRVFTRKQVTRYHARGGTFDARCTCSAHDGFTCDAARTARRDPSGTLDLRRAFIKNLEARWRKLSQLVTQAMVRDDTFGIASISARSLSIVGMQGGRVPAFQTWIDTALADVILGTNREEWIGRYVAGAYGRGFARAARQVQRTDMHVLADRADLLVKLTVTELQGVMEAVSQAAVRAMGNGLVQHAQPRDVARTIRNVISRVGVVRSRSTVQYMVVRAANEGTLDVMELAGRTHVNLVPETLPSPGRSAPVRDTLNALFDAPRRRRRRVRLAEIITAGDDDVCPECEDLEEGNPYTVAEARGLIPAHPNCRCAWMPLDEEVQDSMMPVADVRVQVAYRLVRGEVEQGQRLRDGAEVVLVRDLRDAGSDLLEMDADVQVWEVDLDSVDCDVGPVEVHLPPGTLFEMKQFDEARQLWMVKAWPRSQT